MRLSDLKVRHKVLLPPLVGAVAAVVALALSLTLARRADVLLRAVAGEHAPALEASRDAEMLLEALQQELRDAVATEDSGALAATDATAGLIAKRLADLGESGASLRAEAAAYHRAAREASARIVAKEMGEGVNQAVRAMSSGYAALRERLAGETGRRRQAMQAALERASALQRSAAAWSAAIIIAAAIAAGALGAWLVRSLSRPLEALQRAASRIASEGDLTQTIDVASQDEIGALAASFASMVERLRAILSTLKTASDDLGGASGALSQLTREQTQALESQASGVAETTAATHELEQTAGVAATQASSVLDVARKAAGFSASGQDAAARSVEGIQAIQGRFQGILERIRLLSEQARQVGEIVQTVKELAAQSRVLSLNASIEAARAGEAGRGFAVVASEVHSLADQSATSAARIATIVRDIAEAIEGMVSSAEESSRSMAGSLGQINASGESLREIGVIVRETSDAALQIATALQQQSTGVVQIAEAMRSIDAGMAESMKRVDGLGEAAGRLSRTSARIAGIVGEFRT